MKQKTILLTGATGFLGSHLLKAFLHADLNVVILKRSTSNIFRIKNILEGLYSYNMDETPLKKVFEIHQIDAVVHTANSYGRKNESPLEIISTNINMGIELLQLAIQYKVGSFLNADTMLPRNLNPYALSKNQFVDWLHMHASYIQVINLKMEYIYGPNDDISKLIPWVISELQNQAESINLTAGEQERDFIYIDDITNAFVTLINSMHKLKSFNEFEIGTGKPTTFKLFLENLKKEYDYQFGKTATRLDFGKLPYRKGDLMKSAVDIQPLLDLGWKPQFDHSTGLKKTIESTN
jgi:nucleoside-diphosphate-sugar epimerase